MCQATNWSEQPGKFFCTLSDERYMIEIIAPFDWSGNCDKS
jgi:hypothetical protein